MRLRRRIQAVVDPARRLLAGHQRAFAALGAIALLAGLLEAAVLVIVVPLVQGIADEKSQLLLDVPGLEGPWSIEALFIVGGTAVVGRMLVQLALARRRARLITSFDAGLRRRVFHAYLAADWSVQSSQRGTHVQEVLTGHLAGAQLLLGAVVSGWVALFSLAIMLGAAVVVNLVGAVLIVALGATMAVLLRPLARRGRAISKRVADAQLDLVQEIGDAASLSREIRVFGIEEGTRERFDRQVAWIAHERTKGLTLTGAVPALYQNLVVLMVLVGLAGIYVLVPSQLASLAVVVLVLIRAMAYSQTMQVSYHQLNDAAPFLDRVLESEARLLARPRRRGGRTLQAEHIQQVRFAGVGYRYPDVEPLPDAEGDPFPLVPHDAALRDVDLTLRRGTVVGVVGPSGAGKSTFVQLLLGLREPTEGSILVDGVDVHEVEADAWFDHVSLVPQEPILMATSIRDNIRFRRPDVGDDVVEEAARRAHVHDEVLGLRDGYDTAVGERGGQVSGGQRQRICIARALVGDPDLVVFDEPTSALDPQSEQRIQQTIDELRRRALVVVVAHRLSTLDRCDEIVVFRDGRLLAHGPAGEVRRDDPWVAEAVALGAGPDGGDR